MLQWAGVINMHGKKLELLMALIAGVVCPALIFGSLKARQTDPVEVSQDTAPVTQATTVPAQVQQSVTVSVLLPDGRVESQKLESYITSVVLREMPADFEPEALKAQAVVARTYTLRHKAQGTKHAGADICTDAACCQGYRMPEEYLQNGGSEEKLQKVAKAVADTEGQVLTYGGKLIEATYFSCSGGMTEDAAAVWGSELPYLQAVISPGEEQASHYTDTVTFTAKEFQSKLNVQLSGSPEAWIGKVTYTEGGGVATMRIGGKDYTGVQLRQLLGLRSTALAITAVGNTVTVTTKGFGHRVGMSQYGADAMAVTGSTYDRILAHYYQNTQLVHWVDVD